MDDKEKKLSVLWNIAKVLNSNNIIWAVGGSMLLYFKDRTDVFNDIDIMVQEKDVERLKKLLLGMGDLTPQNPNKQYKTRHFLEFSINGVDIDVIAGFVIVCNGKDYDCSLEAQQIAEYTSINGEKIPLQSLDNWRRYYELMGRTDKVEMIDGHIKNS